MKKYIIVTFLITVMLYGKSFNSIKFTGDVDLIAGEFDRATLLKICHIEYPPIYKIWKSDPVFESKDIKAFEDSVIEYSKSMGYYRVEVASHTSGDTIYLDIKKHEPIDISSVLMDNEFRRFALFKQGERFRTTDFSETKKRISRYLEEHGYPTYMLKAKALVDLDLYKVDITMDIDKGEKKYFSTTEINNSSKVDKELILEELTYKAGEVYDIRKVEESYDNIYRLGVFERIKMEADFNQSLGKSPLSITLEEGKTKEFASNIGYDTEEGARGGVEYIDHNFFGNLREFRAGLKLSERGYKVETSFYDPRIVENDLVGKITLRNELGYSRWDYDSYIEKLFTERVTFGKYYFQNILGEQRRFDHFFGFQMEHSEIESGVPDFFSGNYLINSLFYRFVLDARDDVMDAKNGYYTSLYLEKSMKQIGSEIDYLKVLGEARYIKEFDPIVMAAKVKVGTISEETPPFKHFFLGGAMSNRGYEYRDLGTHSAKYPLGGLSMIDASLEERYYLTENFSVVGFLDASKLSLDVNRFDEEWYTSFGTGLRYLSVIGPLRFDIGFPTDGGFALHLGIGQVF